MSKLSKTIVKTTHLKFYDIQKIQNTQSQSRVYTVYLCIIITFLRFLTNGHTRVLLKAHFIKISNFRNFVFEQRMKCVLLPFFRI